MAQCWIGIFYQLKGCSSCFWCRGWCVCVCVLNDAWGVCITEMMQRSKLQQTLQRQHCLCEEFAWCFIWILKPLNHISFWSQGSKSHLQGQVDVVMFYRGRSYNVGLCQLWKLLRKSLDDATLVFWECVGFLKSERIRHYWEVVYLQFLFFSFSCMWCVDLLLSLCHSSGPVVSAALKIHHHVWAVPQLQFQLQWGACVCHLSHSLELMTFCGVLLGIIAVNPFSFVLYHGISYIMYILSSVFTLLSTFLGL